MTRGGKRHNSGPKKSMSPYGEPTSVIRIPNSIKPSITLMLASYKANADIPIPKLEGLFKMRPEPLPVARPIYSGRVAAGQSRFPSPAQDYEQEELDLNKHLIANPPATFFFRVGNSYDSMIDVGIQPAALLVVDRSITPKSSHIVVAEVEGELMVKKLYKWRNTIELRSENKEKNYPAISFTDGQELVIWGVVKFNVNAF